MPADVFRSHLRRLNKSGVRLVKLRIRTMNKRIFSMALLAGSLAIASNLPAQDNRGSKTRQPTLEDRIEQLEQNDQSLKGQIDQLRNDVVDLQDRMKGFEGGEATFTGGAAGSRFFEVRWKERFSKGASGKRRRGAVLRRILSGLAVWRTLV